MKYLIIPDYTESPSNEIYKIEDNGTLSYLGWIKDICFYDNFVVVTYKSNFDCTVIESSNEIFIASKIEADAFIPQFDAGSVRIVTY